MISRIGQYGGPGYAELLEGRFALSVLGVGDSNHDGLESNLDYQAALCHLATAYASRPAAATAYQETSLPLFATGGPIYSDARQGGLGDCYVISTLAEVAHQSPATIESMFTDNFDGTYEFRYYTNPQPYTQNGTPHYLTIDTELPSGYAAYTNCTWAALAEKGLATVHGGSYANLNSGSCLGSLSEITGHKWLLPFFTDPIAEAQAAFDAGSPIALETGLTPSNPEVIGRHAYAMLGYDAAAETVTLYNPWGYSQLFSYADISDTDNFRAIVGVTA